MRRIFLTLIFCLCATSVFAGPEIFLMASKKTSAIPGTITFNSLSNSPAQLTGSWTADANAATYNFYYAKSSVASLTTNDCIYLLLTAYDVGLDTYPTCTSGSAGSCTATAGKVTGITSTSYTISSDPTLDTVAYCARVTGVSVGSVESVLGSTPRYAAAAVVSPCPGYQSGNNCTWPAGTYTYTVPSGTTSINILAKGGGGGGNDDFCDSAGKGGDTTITYLSVVKATAFGGFGAGSSGDGTESGTLGSEVNTTGGGGAGGAGDTVDCGSPAGNGGKVSGTLAVTAGNTVTVVVGSGGSANNDGSGGATDGADGSVVITW